MTCFVPFFNFTYSIINNFLSFSLLFFFKYLGVKGNEYGLLNCLTLTVYICSSRLSTRRRRYMHVILLIVTNEVVYRIIDRLVIISFKKTMDPVYVHCVCYFIHTCNVLVNNSVKIPSI